MNISYKWLKRYIDFDLSPRDLAAALTSLGLECDNVEEVETIRGGLRGVVIGKVLTCTDHPDSDHLHITTCDLGTGSPVQIVCGAPNVAAGQTVVVATVGTKLYSGDEEMQIRKSKIRGVESFGMICAEDELGLGTAHDGIMVLPDGIAPGTPAAEYFHVESDYCLEVELTPNRVDAASHYGVARDLRAWLARNEATLNDCGPNEVRTELPELRLPSVADFNADRTDGGIPVEVDDTEGCPRYSGITVRGVKVTESPEWLRNLLLAVGQRPINNIVDITNFILLGLGQPLHCFDLGKVRGGKIVVRTCAEGTPFVTLDGAEHKLNPADLMVCDAEGPMALAGVFGGLDSGVTEQTTDVFIESAYFNPTRVRKTARRHGLSTDASFRYERGADPLITVYAAKLAALMVKELAGGEICGPVVDVCKEPAMPFHVSLSLTYLRQLIGMEIPRPLVELILRALEITVNPEGDDVLALDVPPYRVDVQRPCDVAEEVLRVFGYNNVPISTAMHANLSQKQNADFSNSMRERVADRLTARGYREIMNNSLTAVSYYADNEAWPEAECVRLLNPLSGDLAVMRRTLLYGGLESVAHNLNRKSGALRFYEFGNVYALNPQKEVTAEKPLAPFSEEMHLALWLAGHKNADSWHEQASELDFYDLRADVESTLRSLGVSDRQYEAVQTADTIYRAALELKVRGGGRLGVMGILRPEVLKRFGIDRPVVYAELRWAEVFALAQRRKTLYAPLPKTQPVRRDLALLVSADTRLADLEATARKAGGKLLRQTFLFDVYEGKNLPEGTKSYAMGFILQDDEKTLQDKQIDAVMGKITDALTRTHNATLR